MVKPHREPGKYGGQGPVGDHVVIVPLLHQAAQICLLAQADIVRLEQFGHHHEKSGCVGLHAFFTENAAECICQDLLMDYQGFSDWHGRCCFFQYG